MSTQASRNWAPGGGPGNCPRCGVALEQSYKYCPNCACRLRPELAPGPQRADQARTALGTRLIALGGYLAFASMVLLVTLAGFRLFAEPQVDDATGTDVRRARDPHCLPLTLNEFRPVASGDALWGLYDERAYDVVGTSGRPLRIRHSGVTSADPDAEAHGFRTGERVTQTGSGAKGVVMAPLDDSEATYLLCVLPEEGVFDDVHKIVGALSKAECMPSEIEDDRPSPVQRYRVDDPFLLGTYEVTNDQYFEFLDAWAHKAKRRVPEWMFPVHWNRVTGRARVTRIYEAGRGDFPVTNVLVAAARSFCAWYWEERLGGPADRIVDLPQALEHLIAARTDLENHFPWGTSLIRGITVVNLDGEPMAVNDPRVGAYGGFFALVGNAAEWVYGFDQSAVALAAGWSFRNGVYYQLWEEADQPGSTALRRTPFSRDGYVATSPPQSDVGFRILIREAPAMPTFAFEVTPGEVRLGPPSKRLLPPPVYAPQDFGEDEGPVEPEPVARLPRVTFRTSAQRRVSTPVRIARTAITNRQYLTFLVEASERDPAVGRKYRPSAWVTPHPWNWVDSSNQDLSEDAVFRGPYGDPKRVVGIYGPGQENRPVQGVSPGAARAYAAWLSRKLGHACRLPTIAEYVRAGRGDRPDPYPWGTNPSSTELVCAGRADDEQRSESLLGRLGSGAPAVVGLVGNVAEYVVDDEYRSGDTRGRLLLAGGCYVFPPALCTLDTFMDASWRTVQYTIQGEETAVGPFAVAHYAGFRLVLAQERP